jgi:hypothetical protein
MGAEALLHAAVLNNARWCDAVLADPDCAILACHRDGSLIGGATTYTTDGVTGI